MTDDEIRKYLLESAAAQAGALPIASPIAPLTATDPDHDPTDTFVADGTTYRMNRDAHAWHGADPTVFIDSNVMNELYTVHDLAKVVETQERTGGMVSPEQWRLWARGSLWFASALDEMSTVSASLASEPFRFVLHKAGPSTWQGGWVTVWLHFVQDFVFPRWTPIALHKRRGSHKANDTMIAEECRNRRIPLVTRDKGLVKKAATIGASPYSPEEFARNVISLETARTRFFDRYDHFALPYCVDYACRNPDATWLHEAEIAAVALRRVRGVYDYIWSDEPDTFEMSSPVE